MPGSLCPCGLPTAYAACCGRFHHGDAAPTAESLMRSRYSAFALGDEAYLRLTWDRATRPRRIGLDPATVWTRLEIVGSTRGGALDDEGTVEFRAHYSVEGLESGVQHENSTFRRVDGRWLYVAAL